MDVVPNKMNVFDVFVKGKILAGEIVFSEAADEANVVLIVF
jgi:hypothetical protein